MSIAVTSWDQVTQADYDAAFLLLSQIVAERHPELDQRRGAIHDVNMMVLAVLSAALRIEEARLLESNSILAIQQDPTLADPETAARLFSRFLVQPRAGSQAAGLVTVVVSKDSPLVIPAGSVFTANSQQYTADYSVAARANSADILSPTDKLLLPQVDGTYLFTFNVTAVASGASGIISQRTTVLPVKPIANFVAAYAAQDFTGGQDPDTVTTMLARLENGIAAKTWSNAANIAALVRSHTAFPDAHVSVIGAGAPEMLRDKHSVIPISFGNRMDVWVKQPAIVTTVNLTKSATYTGLGADGPLWSLALTRADLPGVYAVTSVVRTGRGDSASVRPSSFTRDYVPSSGDPDIVNALEAGFSRYQSGVVTFSDNFNVDESLSVGDTVDYTVTAILTADLGDLQDFLDSPTLRPVSGDVVVRGAAPMFVSVELQLDAKPATVSEADISAAIAGYVNGSGFDGYIYASKIAALVLPLLPSGVNLKRIRMSGILFRPDGSTSVYRDRELLQVPDEPSRMVTAKTTAFYLDPSAVSVNAPI
jgi:uncharacterized phage protein gp47/JayE